MNSILESVEWGEPALSLLSQSRELDPKLPAVMQIRHSERSHISSREERGANLTESGRRAACEFGSSLPITRSYRLFHSTSDRAKETAEEIHRGLRSIDAEACIGGVFIRSHSDQEKLWDYLTRDIISQGERTARPFFINWASGHFPPWELEPCRMFAQRAASAMMKNLDNHDTSGFDIYVSHDIWVASCLFYWFGIMPSVDWIGYLDGFILQQTDDCMNVYFKDGKKEAYYPYWWGFKPH
jgi:broad specificity phosphatase PhoE